MSTFRIDTKGVPGKMDSLARLRKKLTEGADLLDQYVSELHSEELSGIRSVLRKLSKKLQTDAEAVKKLETGLEEAAGKYMILENRLRTPKPAGENPAYDEEGNCGGSQLSPMAFYRGEDGEIRQGIQSIIRSYYPGLDDRGTEKLLADLELEGCGYVALANTLFGQYAGREEQFLKVFGFPMYAGTGELNFELLVTDLYCSKDKHWKTGTTREEREEIWEDYLEEKGIPVDVRTVEVTAENYEELSWEGELIVGINPCILFDSDGKKVVETEGGHAMTITGMTDDGMFKVSSWGMEYYIMPDDPAYERIQFQQVCY